MIVKLKKDVGGGLLKSDYDKLGIRLARIITLLLCGEKLDVNELADEFNVTTRTIVKDLDINSLVQINGVYGQKLKYISFKEFDQAMLSDNVIKI